MLAATTRGPRSVISKPLYAFPIGRSYATKTEAVQEAEILERSKSSEGDNQGSGSERKTNPFSDSLVERWTPNLTQMLNILAGTLMLSMGLKMIRERGEAIERENRLRDRMAEVELQLEVLAEDLPVAVSTAVVSKRGASEAVVVTAVREVVVAAVGRAREEAKKRFEAGLWDEQVQPAKESAGGVETTTAAAGGTAKDTRMY